MPAGIDREVLRVKPSLLSHLAPHAGIEIDLACRHIVQVRGPAREIDLAAIHGSGAHDAENIGTVRPLQGAERKAIGLRRHEQADKRGGGQVRGESVLEADFALSSAAPGIGQLAGCEPTPQFAAQVQEEYGRLYALLTDDTLRQIARGKLDGYTNSEIAARLKLSLRAVERKLQLIRRQWSQELES